MPSYMLPRALSLLYLHNLEGGYRHLICAYGETEAESGVLPHSKVITAAPGGAHAHAQACLSLLLFCYFCCCHPVITAPCHQYTSAVQMSQMLSYSQAQHSIPLATEQKAAGWAQRTRENWSV